MSTTLEPHPQVRSPLLSTAPWIILLTLAQIGLMYYGFAHASSWLPWLAGAPLCNLLISLLAVFRAGGYRSWGHAVKRGALIGIIVWGASAVLIALAELLWLIWRLYYYQPPPGYFQLGVGLFLYAEIFYLLIILLCIVPAVLGGLLGGFARFMIGRSYSNRVSH